MAVSHRLEQRLQISVGPLSEGAVGAHRSTRVEYLAQLDDESLPLRFAEPSIERDRSPDSNRQSEKLSHCATRTKLE